MVLGVVLLDAVGQKSVERTWTNPNGPPHCDLSKQTNKDSQMSDGFNMSMRKFLKQVGVTSQQAIETALRDAEGTKGKSFEAKVVLTIDGLELEHVVSGTIKDETE